jgi:branched-chain amino acid transport system permease protein
VNNGRVDPEAIGVLVLLGVGFGLLLAVPKYGSVYDTILATDIMMYIVLAVSWAVFSGPTGYISLAPAAFFGVGIYTSALLGMTLPLLAVIAIAGLVTCFLALFVGAVTLRLRGMYFAIFTFGLVELIKNVVLWYEITFTGTRGRFVVVVDSDTRFYIMLGILAVLLIAAYFFRRSRFGLALQSIGENEEAAAHSGVNVTLLKVVTFAASASFMGAAGAVIATRLTYIDPQSAFNAAEYSFMPVVMAIFGGMGQLSGPLLGATVFAYLREKLITEYPYYYMLTVGIILVLVVLFLPGGLVGLLQRVVRWVLRWWSRRQHAST